MTNGNLSRRDFLNLVFAGGAATVAAAKLPKGAQAASGPQYGTGYNFNVPAFALDENRELTAYLAEREYDVVNNNSEVWISQLGAAQGTYPIGADKEGRLGFDHEGRTSWTKDNGYVIRPRLGSGAIINPDMHNHMSEVAAELGLKEDHLEDIYSIKFNGNILTYTIWDAGSKDYLAFSQAALGEKNAVAKYEFLMAFDVESGYSMTLPSQLDGEVGALVALGFRSPIKNNFQLDKLVEAWTLRLSEDTVNVGNFNISYLFNNEGVISAGAAYPGDNFSKFATQPWVKTVTIGSAAPGPSAPSGSFPPPDKPTKPGQPPEIPPPNVPPPQNPPKVPPGKKPKVGQNPGNDKPVGGSRWDGHTGASNNNTPKDKGVPHMQGDDSETPQPPGTIHNNTTPGKPSNHGKGPGQKKDKKDHGKP